MVLSRVSKFQTAPTNVKQIIDSIMLMVELPSYELGYQDWSFELEKAHDLIDWDS